MEEEKIRLLFEQMTLKQLFKTQRILGECIEKEIAELKGEYNKS